MCGNDLLCRNRLPLLSGHFVLDLRMVVHHRYDCTTKLIVKYDRHCDVYYLPLHKATEYVPNIAAGPGCYGGYSFVINLYNYTLSGEKK